MLSQLALTRCCLNFYHVLQIPLKKVFEWNKYIKMFFDTRSKPKVFTTRIISSKAPRQTISNWADVGFIPMPIWPHYVVPPIPILARFRAVYLLLRGPVTILLVAPLRRRNTARK